MTVKPKKPVERPGYHPTGRLMDMQDTKNKGDGLNTGKVMMSFMIPRDLRDELRVRAQELGTSSSRLILDGIRLRLKQED